MLSKLKDKLFHPPYYRALTSPDPVSQLAFIERVQKIWGFTSVTCEGYTNKTFAPGIVKSKNATMRLIYGEHRVYNEVGNAQ